MSIPKPSPPRLSAQSLDRFRSILDRERDIRQQALDSRFWPHPTLKMIVASCDEGIADIIKSYPEVNQ